MVTYKYDPSTGTYTLVDDSLLLTGLSVSTDQTDYTPDSIATFTASNVTVGGTVEFIVAHDNPGEDGVVGTADDYITYDLSGTTPWFVTDGGPGDLDGVANGVVVTSWNVNWDATNQAFLLSAVDLTTGIATTTSFTDAVHFTPVDAVAPNGTNGMIFTTAGAESTGTGVFPAFVELNSPANSSTESGYNPANPPIDNTGSSAVFNHPIQVKNLDVETINNQQYYVFRLDANEPNDAKDAAGTLVLNSLKLFYDSTGTATPDVNGLPTGATLLYDMDGGLNGDISITLTDWSSGSGHGDYIVSIPVSAHLDPNTYIYLYSSFSDATGGFEEWALGPNAPPPPPPPTPHAALSLTKDTVCPDPAHESVAGGTLLAGKTIEWTYTVKDVGSDGTYLANLTLSDDQLGTLYTNGAPVAGVTLTGDTNNDGILEKGETWVFTATGTTVDTSALPGGIYSNTGTITADGFSGNPLGSHTETDPGLSGFDTSNYVGVTVTDASIAVDKLVSIDGGKTYVDSDSATGPILLSGYASPMFEYTLKNNGPLAISAQTLTDDNGTPGNTSDDFSTTQANGAGSMIVQVLGQDATPGEGDSSHNIGDVNDNGVIDPGETWTFAATGVWAQGQQTNTVTTSATFTDDCGNTANATGTAVANYFGANPGVSITKDIACPDDGHLLGADKKTVNLLDNKAGTVTYEIVVKNTGNVALINPTVTDPTLGALGTPTQTGGSGSNTDNILDVGETWTYIVTALWAMGGPHTNTADVSVSFTDGAGNTFTEDPSDSASYYGLNPHIALNKLTNGSDGPTLLQGKAITWTYDVKNDGNVALSNVSVTDNPAQTITAVMSGLYNSGDTNDNGVLDPGETWHFIATGVAIAGSYSNLATATTHSVTDDCGDSVTPTATDGSSYTGLAQAQDGLTKGYWATHLTLWDVWNTDNSGTTDINPTPQYDWNHSGGSPAITDSAVVKTGPTSGLGAVSGSNNGGGDSGLLMGDLNHDGLANDTQDLFFDLASAQVLANSSVSGDARVILGSQAVAAQLNEYKDYVLYGHDTSPNGLINEAVQWLKGTGLISNGDSKVNWSISNDLASPAVQAIIDLGTTATNDYTISGGAITFKSTSLSSSDASWNKFVAVFNEATATPTYHPNTGNATVDATQYTVTTDGEGLKNALAAYNHGLSTSSTAGFVTSQDGSLIGWQDSSTGTPYDVHANTVDAFWGILEDQNLLYAATGGAHGIQIVGVAHA